MDGTRGIDRNLSLEQQLIVLLDKRYLVEGTVLGGSYQLHKKVASAIMSLSSDYFYKHPEEIKPYVED